MNSILSSDDYRDLTLGKVYNFSIVARQIFSEQSPLWLTNNDHTALAEITMIKQNVVDKILTGTFRVDYIYQEFEQQTVSKMIMRRYLSLHDEHIYLLSSYVEYQQAKSTGFLVRDSLQSEGFIHAAPQSQLNRLANKYHKNTVQPLILILDKKRIKAEVKWEPATGGLYPHIYGALNMDAIIDVEAIGVNSDGVFEL
ncbi:MAG: hypothetical protein ACI9LM_003519 [Alteromonadaceae bacterium]|jgi:uncharacterized protein (DUF952 family)